jgi:hypothetical protein
MSGGPFSNAAHGFSSAAVAEPEPSDAPTIVVDPSVVDELPEAVVPPLEVPIDVDESGRGS